MTVSPSCADDSPHGPAEIEHDQARPKRLAGQTGAGPAGVNRQRLLGRIPHGGLHVSHPRGRTTPSGRI